MKSRTTLVFVVLAAVSLVISACGGAAPAEEETTPAEVGEIQATGQKTALITVQERGDRGVVDALVEGFLKGAAQYGYDDARVIVVTDPATYESTLRQLAEEDFNLIMTTFPPMIDAVTSVAPDFPDTNFVLVDARLETGMPNVQELFFLENESSYLAGLAAGMMTKTNQVGFIGALDADVINRYAVGFYEGAHAANPDVSVCWTYTNALEDPAKGREVALSFYNQGIDIIHAATAGTQLGIYKASQEVEKYMISADVDVIPLNPDFGLFATGPKFDQAMVLQLRDHAQGTWEAGFKQYGLESDLVGITPFNQALVPLEVQQAVLEAQQAITAGTIQVNDDRMLANLENCS